jgi:branched-chain amino acid transport system ATP-binding protein
MFLEIRGLVIHYGTAEVIKGLSVSVEAGTVVSIIGANGAGKSTLLKAISGLIPASSGEIIFMGKRLNGLPVQRIVKMGILHVPEDKKLFPYMTVVENLRLGAFLRTDKKRIEEDLERVFGLFPRLRERCNQKARSLSGGEQQMLAIGRALMARPKLLMMDEPSLGLAPVVIDQLAQTIREIRKEGIAILLVEQNAGLVTEVSDKCYVMEVGKVVLEGRIKDVLLNPSVRRAFLGG